MLPIAINDVVRVDGSDRVGVVVALVDSVATLEWYPRQGIGRSAPRVPYHVGKLVYLHSAPTTR